MPEEDPGRYGITDAERRNSRSRKPGHQRKVRIDGEPTLIKSLGLLVGVRRCKRSGALLPVVRAVPVQDGAGYRTPPMPPLTYRVIPTGDPKSVFLAIHTGG